MKFVVDMNLSPQWVGFLAGAGFDAVHWSDVGRANATDAEVLAWVAERSCILLTNDLDFGAILAATGGRKPSVLQLRSELLHPHALGEMVLSAIRETGADLAAGALVSINARAARLRILPLTS